MTDILDRLTSTPSIVAVAIIILGSWRLSWFLMRDGGPFGIMVEVRERMGFSHTLDNIPLPYHGGFPGTLFACMWCMTFWTSIVVFLIWAAFPPVTVVLAVWGGACVVESVVGYWHVNSMPIQNDIRVEGGIESRDNNRKEAHHGHGD